MTVIVINPGHGGQDLGVTWPLVKGSYTYELVEADLTLAISFQLRRALLGLGWNIAVEMTRDDKDEDMSLHTRGELAEKYGADLVLSIHVNSNPEPVVSGAMTFHWPGNDAGQAVGETISRCMPNELRRIHTKSWPATDEK